MKEEMNSTKKRSKLKRIMIYLITIGFSVLIVLYGIVCRIIFSDVKEICTKAAREFEGDAVEVNVQLLQSDNHGYTEKNDAVWALGQIGDIRALPTLDKLYTGNPCEKPCRKDNKICQYQLETAIKSCRGGFSVTKWMYRFL